MGAPLRVFISYSPEDAALKGELVKQLRVLERSGLVDVWSDDQIEPGANWRDEIDQRIKSSDVALLLVSASYLSSPFLNDSEIPELLKQREAAGLVVIPVILGDCLWQHNPALAPFQPLPKNAKPISRHKENKRAKALAEVAEAVAAIARDRGSDAQAQPRKAFTTASALHQLRAPPADFTGRAEELHDLRAKLGEGGAIIAGLTGQGGVGKTALALRLAEELRDQYPDAQIDIDLRGVDSQPLAPEAVMAEVIRAFDPMGKLPEGVEALGKVYRSVLDGKRALLFFDNARDRAQIEPLIPPRGSLLLVTSRSHFTLPGIHMRRLHTLPEFDAVALARSIAPELDAGTAEELAMVCGYLPLALRAAASVLAERIDTNTARYLDRLRGNEGVKLVEEVLASSLELLVEPARDFWRRLGVMPTDFDAPAAAAVGGVSPEEAEKHLGELVHRSLLEWDAVAKRYRLHDLARSYAWSRLGADERDTTQRRHATHFGKAARGAEERYWQGGAGVAEGLRAFDREWPHIKAAKKWASECAGSDDAAARACDDLILGSVNLLALRLHPRERIAWLEAALTVSRRWHRRAEEGAALGNLGIAYLNLGEAHKAIELNEEYLVIAREVGDRRGEGNARGNLGSAYRKLGETRKAIELFAQHLFIAREVGDRRGEGNALGKLGSAYSDLGEARRAIELFEQQLVVAREVGDRRNEGNALGNLGVVHRNLGETRRALELGEQRIAIAREVGDRRGESIGSWNLGLAYEKLDDLRRAVEVMRVRIDFERSIGHRDLERNEAYVGRLRARLKG
jgi:tetratricopeptide (TPR) repeat protein